MKEVKRSNREVATNVAAVCSLDGDIICLFVDTHQAREYARERGHLTGRKYVVKKTPVFETVWEAEP